ncbi:MAG: hypothetical protein LBH17_03580, partial [Oscillospiraceae bacterium]|nr:hypothetical protein [Oscillospiraceae bacterium]
MNKVLIKCKEILNKSRGGSRTALNIHVRLPPRGGGIGADHPCGSRKNKISKNRLHIVSRYVKIISRTGKSGRGGRGVRQHRTTQVGTTVKSNAYEHEYSPPRLLEYTRIFLCFQAVQAESEHSHNVKLNTPRCALC